MKSGKQWKHQPDLFLWNDPNQSVHSPEEKEEELGVVHPGNVCHRLGILCLLLLLIVSPVRAPTIASSGGDISLPSVISISVGGDSAGILIIAGESFSAVPYGISVNLDFKPGSIVIDDVSINTTAIPGDSGGMVTMVAYAGRPVSPTFVCNKEGKATINLNVSSLVLAEPVPLLFVHVRPTDQAGISTVNVSGLIFNGFPEGQPFDTMINGTINAHGGYPTGAMGTVIFPSGTVVRGSTVTLPLKVGILEHANFSVFLSPEPPSPLPPLWIPAVTMSDISLNGTIPGIDVNKLSSGAEVSGADGITRDTVTDLLNVTFSAAEYGTDHEVVFFANRSFVYRNMPSNGFRVTYPFASATDGVITVTDGGGGGGMPELWFPSGFLAPGAEGSFTVLAANMTDIRQVNIEFQYNISKIVIENITVNNSIPGLSIGAETEILQLDLQGTGMPLGSARINITHPMGFTVTSPQVLFYLTIRAVNEGGWEDLDATRAYYNGSFMNKITTYNGSIYSSGGGHPGLNTTIIAPDGVVPEGGEATFQVLLANFTNANNFTVYLWSDSPAITFTNVEVNPVITGPDVQYSGDNNFIWAAIQGIFPATYDFFSSEPVWIANVTIKANGSQGESGRVTFFNPYFPDMSTSSRWGQYPGFNVIYPFTFMQNGTITIGPPAPTTIIAPSGSVMQGETVTLPLSIANLTNADVIVFNLGFNSSLISIEDVQLIDVFCSDVVLPSWDVIFPDNSTGVLIVTVMGEDQVTHQPKPIDCEGGGGGWITNITLAPVDSWAPSLTHHSTTEESVELSFINLSSDALRDVPITMVAYHGADWFGHGHIDVQIPFDIKSNGHIDIIAPPIPVTNFTSNITRGSPPLIVQFNDTSTTSRPSTTWLWSFGDESDSTIRNPVHTYLMPGIFPVSLNTTNAAGSNLTIKTGYITVFPKGDFNNNWRVDIGDVTRVAYMAVNLTDWDPAADFNGDAKVDIGDASKIAWYYVGKVAIL